MFVWGRRQRARAEESGAPGARTPIEAALE